MSSLRPELRSGNPDGKPLISNGTAYLMILSAVKTRRGLIHGRLHAAGEHCAIGSYFEINKQTCLPADLIDEVAAVNDSVPHLTERSRKLHVAKWLRWKLAQLGYPSYARK